MNSNRIAIVTLLAVSLVGFSKEPEAYSRTVSVKSLLKSTTTSEGKPLSFPSDTAEVDGNEVTIPAGSSTGWHSHA
ncbi:MAG: cupin domain-containing protein, partial [Fibrobacterota bacterium]